MFKEIRDYIGNKIHELANYLFLDKLFNFFRNFLSYNNIRILSQVLFGILLFLAFIIIGIFLSRDYALLSVIDENSWRYFFSAIMQTFGTIAAFLIAISIFVYEYKQKNTYDVLWDLFWLFFSAVFIIIICIVSLYETHFVYTKIIDFVLYEKYNLRLDNLLLISVIYLCLIHLFFMVFFLYNLSKKLMEKRIDMKILLILFFTFLGLILGSMIRVLFLNF